MNAPTYFLLGLIFFIGAIIYLLFKYTDDNFNNWYHDSAITQKENTFKYNSFRFSDIFHLILLSIFLILLFNIPNLIGKVEAEFLTYLSLSGVFFGIVVSFYFYKRYLFFKLNYKNTFTFLPVDKTIIINGKETITINENNIHSFINYSLKNTRIDFSFSVIKLLSGKEIVITSDLPFLNSISDFLNLADKFNSVQYSVFYSFKMFKILKAHI